MMPTRSASVPARPSSRSSGKRPRSRSPMTDTPMEVKRPLCRDSRPPSPRGRTPSPSERALSPRLRSGLGLPPPQQLPRAHYTTCRSCSAHPRGMSRPPSRRQSRSPSPRYARSPSLRSFRGHQPSPRLALQGAYFYPMSSVDHLKNRALERLPRLECMPKDYREVRNFLTAIETAAGANPTPQALADLMLAHMSGEIQSILKDTISRKYPQDASPYNTLVRALIGAVVTEDPETFLQNSLANVDEREVPLKRMHMHVKTCYNTYRDLCQRLQRPVVSTPSVAVDAFLAALPEATVGKVFERAGDAWINIQEDLDAIAEVVHYVLNVDDRTKNFFRRNKSTKGSRDTPPNTSLASPTKSPASDHQSPRRRARDVIANPNHMPIPAWNSIHYVQQQSAQPTPALTFPRATPALPQRPPMGTSHPNTIPLTSTSATSAQRASYCCFFCGSATHRLRQCPQYLAACREDPTRAQRCPVCNSPGLCPADCRRRTQFAQSSSRYLELNYLGHSYFIREDRVLPEWFRPELLVGTLGGTSTRRVAQIAHAPAPVLAPPVPPPPGVGSPLAPAVIPPAPLAGGRTAPASSVAAPTTPASAQPLPSPSPVAARVVMHSDAPQVASCMHARTHRLPPNPHRPAHTRALATIDGVRCEVIIDTGADLSLISATLLRPSRKYRPWREADGRVTGVAETALSILGRISLEVRLGPLKAQAPFVVALGLSFPALLGVDFLYEHDITVSLAQHALLFESLNHQVHPLLGPHPRFVHACTVRKDVQIPPHSRVWIHAPCRSHTATLATTTSNPSCVFWVRAQRFLNDTLYVPEQLSSGFVEVQSRSDKPVFLGEGWPLASASPISPKSIYHAQLVPATPPHGTPPADPSPAAASTAPAYTKVPGGFLPTLPSPGSCLTDAELDELRSLLAEFVDRFNDGSEPLSATTLLKARLDTANIAPISAPPRRLSPAMRDIVRKAVADLDAQGITEPSTGCWSTPIVMVRKASGAWRLCCDYREINKHVLVPQQPLPRTDDILASFKGKKYFSVLDVCSGFYQIEIAEEDRPKTSFVTPDCQRQYRRLPFGFASSPAIFQRMIDMLLGGMKWVSAIGYIDDIIVYSDTWPDHRAHLRQLLVALRKAALQLHLGHIVSREGIRACPSKVQAIVDMPVPHNVKAVQRFLGKCQYYRRFVPNFSAVAAPLFRATTLKKDFVWTPECQDAWKTLCNALSSEPVRAHPDYSRKFFVDCDGSAEGLGAVLLQPYDEGERVVAYASRQLLPHEKRWTATELEAAALVWALDTFRPYIDGVRVLVRTDHAPLEYIHSRKSQCRRLERWALRLQEFQFDISHRPGTQQKHVDCLSRAPTPAKPDQAPLVLDEFPDRVVLHVCNPAPPHPSSAPPRLVCADACAEVQRLAHRAHVEARLLRSCVLRVAHHPEPRTPTTVPPADEEGLEICLTDYEDEEREIRDTPVQPADAADTADDLAATPRPVGGREVPLPVQAHHADLAKLQAEDPDCKRFRSLVDLPRVEWPAALARSQLAFSFEAGILCVTTSSKGTPRIVLPAALRHRAIHAHHLSYYGGHFGVAKTAERLWVRYWWPSLRRDVKQFLRRCAFCLATTDRPQAWRWLNLPIGTPFELVATDLFGPLRASATGNTHILVFLDHHTRWVELVALPAPTAASVAEAFF
ncbi:hypothetical protein Emed_004662 [Eimeria media]